jgi:hypothetical protein
MTVEGVGGHGCDRTAKAKSGVTSQLNGCGKMDCPDCLFAEFVAKMKKIGSVYKAKMHHWPADMVDHTMDSKGERCTRCGAQDVPYSDGKPSTHTLKDPCRTYVEAQEVIDDYSESAVQYQGLTRAIGIRVKGSF